MKEFRFAKQYCWNCIWLILLLLVPMGSGICNVAEGVALPEPTGAYDIGTTVLHLSDDARMEEMTPDPDDHREMMVQLWYPADNNVSGSPVPYMDAPTIAHLTSAMPDGLGNIFDTVQTHAIALAPPADGPEPFPVLIFSPGLGLVSSVYQSLIEDIVSHGYVVAAINHPYISGITVFPDGRTVLGHNEIDFEFLQSTHLVAVEDIKFVTDQLETVQIGDSTLAPDVDNIGFFGHSFGGSAGLEACLQLPQGRGAINLDGTLFGYRHQQPIDKSILLMSNQGQTLMRDPTWAAAWRNVSQDGYLMRLDGATHDTFNDMELLFFQALDPEKSETTKDKLEAGSIDPQHAIQIMREYAVAFFDTCIKDAPVENIHAIDYPEVAIEFPSNADLFDGIWRSFGYGYLLQIENGNLNAYDTTEMGMVPSLLSQGQQVQISNGYLYAGEQAFGRLSLSDRSFLVVERLLGHDNDYVFEMAQEGQIPEIIDQTYDPEINFEFFWHTFEEHCALFDLTNVDWKALYDQYRPQVNADTTDVELFNILSALATPLNDGHTSIWDLRSPRTFHSGPTPSAIWFEDIPANLDVIASYMDDHVLTSESDDIQYGVIDGSTGYLFIGSFDPSSPDDFIDAVDTVLEKFDHLDTVIVDCRFNGGGDDSMALSVANRFTEQKRLAFSERVRTGGYDEYGPAIERYIAPEGTSFLNKPVILLTSNGTASAADVFAMTMKQLDNVTLIGETTWGIFSDKLNRTLPNGWRISLSNERYRSWEGIDYEQKGISPDIEIIGDPAAWKEGKDNILEKSLDHLNSNGDGDGDGKAPDDDNDGSCFIKACMP